MSTPNPNLTPEPFTLTTHGHHTIPHPAERALLTITITSTGPNKPSVADDVATTAAHLETLLRELSPPAENPTPESKATAPLAHWSKTGLSATSHVPHTPPHRNKQGDLVHPSPQPRQYTSKLTFDIRFQHFAALGAFGTRVAALPCAEISAIDWILTAPTRERHESALRRAATADALAKARDYCDVLCCGDLRPVELTEGDVTTSSGAWNLRAQGAMPQMQCAPGMMQGGGGNARDESPLEFTPREVRMGMGVTVKWHASPALGGGKAVGEGSGAGAGAKRARVEVGGDEEMRE